VSSTPVSKLPNDRSGTIISGVQGPDLGRPDLFEVPFDDGGWRARRFSCGKERWDGDRMSSRISRTSGRDARLRIRGSAAVKANPLNTQNGVIRSAAPAALCFWRYSRIGGWVWSATLRKASTTARALARRDAPGILDTTWEGLACWVISTMTATFSPCASC